ncbi:FAD-dependent oxidoreductase [Lacibacter sp.]|uniref:FAD-dependent oxidoreductase n=1 Tax=Lacibacter sp. TaxID=1915409 RepID=UPI002B4AD0E5|nr:FAD-dependent oxidoreductase [Lacibacter sp.]HLP37073.1 FAD-dependent oxidoreductase [Lacibacter sp.]
MNRRDFIQVGVAATGIAAVVSSCKRKTKIKGSILGASSSVGHLLRDKKFAAPSSTEQKQVVIIGAGVSGLSAARHLQQQGINDIIILELEKHIGGNAANGSNSISAFPFGAHYVPIPNNDLKEYLEFLKSADIITDFNEDGLPVYNEAYLCFDPEERLYINGRWQEGLIPQYGVPAKELKQIERFLAQMKEFRMAKGNDGKDAFAIPVNQSSTDPVYTKLDAITMKEWLLQNNYTSEYLHWYVNYCTRDDFGTPHHLCSAWAGIHYFAGRKGKAANADYSDVLTWPEGNGFLIQQLSKDVHDFVRTESLVTKVEKAGKNIIIHYYDVKNRQLKEITADQCIIAIPQFVAARLFKDEQRIEKVKSNYQYAPWMVANIVTDTLEERSGETLSWDNVIYGSASLGYVNATHQVLQQNIPLKNLTYYLPLTSTQTVEDRKKANEKTHDEWSTQIIQDLKIVHPDIEKKAKEINITLWGHAMVQPVPGIIHGLLRKELASSIDDCIHFAHTDNAGISIFEEGFYQGLEAAKKVMQHVA